MTGRGRPFGTNKCEIPVFGKVSVRVKKLWITRWLKITPGEDFFKIESKKEINLRLIKAWQKKNPERCKQNIKNCWDKNREKYKAKQKEWRQSSEGKEWKKKYNQRPYVKERRKNYKIYLRFGLTREEYDLIVSSCVMCGFNRYPCDCYHIDGDKNNNSRENLVGLCSNCHNGIHRGHFKFQDNSLILNSPLCVSPKIFSQGGVNDSHNN